MPLNPPDLESELAAVIEDFIGRHGLSDPRALAKAVLAKKREIEAEIEAASTEECRQPTPLDRSNRNH